ncbi:MAG: ABC transporter substrate-binding protein [Alphaproteobacteria bacterium]
MESQSRLPSTRFLRWMGGIGVGVATLGLIVVSGAAAQDAPGVTASEIVVGTPMPLTGPVRLVSQPYDIGLRTGLKEINDKGGVQGRKISFSVEDDAYQPARSLAIAKKLMDRDNVFAIFGCFGTPNCITVMRETEQKGVPLLTYSALAGSGPTTFGLTASYGDVSYQLVKYFAKQRGFKKIGFLYQNDDLGENARKGLKRGLDEVGLPLGADVGYDRTTGDFTTHILALRDANPDAVIAMGTAPAIGAAIKKANEIGFKPVWSTYLIGESAIMTKLLGDGINGLVYATDTESLYSSSPEAERVKALIQKASPPDTAIEVLTLQGYAQAKLFGMALDVAGKDLTREKFLSALRSRDYDVGVMKLSYKDGKQIGADALKLYQWEGGKPRPLSDWIPIPRN